MRNLPRVSLLLMVLFCLLLIAGIGLGDVTLVLEKATELCLSCIGIG